MVAKTNSNLNDNRLRINDWCTYVLSVYVRVGKNVWTQACNGVKIILYEHN